MPFTAENIKMIKKMLESSGESGYTAIEIAEKLDSDLDPDEVEWFCNLSTSVAQGKTDEDEIKWILKNP